MSDDLISRQAVLEGLASISKVKGKSDKQKALMGRVMFFTEQLPTFKSQVPKTGHWVIAPKGGIYTHLICSNCLSNAPYDCFTNYCPVCGAKMTEREDDK